MKGRRNRWAIVLVVVLAVVGSCIHEPFIYPEEPGDNTVPGCVNDGQVCFESSVLPIFLSSCAQPGGGCHDAQAHKEGLVLDSYNNIMKEGIVSGNANESKLYKVLFESGEDRMPPDDPNTPGDDQLTQAQKDSIKVWINQGAKNTVNCNCFCDTTAFAFSANINPILFNACVRCHQPGRLEGNVDLSTYEKVKLQADNGKLVGSVSHTIGYSPMPQGGKLPDCEITQIKKWVEAGAPDN